MESAFILFKTKVQQENSANSLLETAKLFFEFIVVVVVCSSFRSRWPRITVLLAALLVHALSSQILRIVVNVDYGKKQYALK